MYVKWKTERERLKELDRRAEQFLDNVYNCGKCALSICVAGWLSSDSKFRSRNGTAIYERVPIDSCCIMYDIMRFIALHENDSNANATAAPAWMGANTKRLKYEVPLTARAKRIFLTTRQASTINLVNFPHTLSEISHRRVHFYFFFYFFLRKDHISIQTCWIRYSQQSSSRSWIFS